jgi:hypothetical protein
MGPNRESRMRKMIIAWAVPFVVLLVAGSALAPRKPT